MNRGLREGLPENLRASRTVLDRTFPVAVDLLILGGGISGASLFSVADASGKRILLIDQGDFASGTSQSSGMMIWGGLLYLRNFELRLVRRLCCARDWLIDNCPAVHARHFQYLPLKRGGKPR